jgi:hypothetical protein
LPRFLHLPAQTGLRFRVAPSSLPFFRAGVRILRFPLGFGPSAVPAMDARVTPNLSCLRRCRFQPGSGLPRRLLSSCVAPDVGLGLPLVLHLRLYRRWIIESPRCSHLSAVPSGQYSSCPAYQPLGIADDSSSRLPRTSNPPAPIDGYPSYPGSLTYRFALVESPSCPGSSSLATAIDQFPGCPKSWVSHRSPIHRVSSCPESLVPRLTRICFLGLPRFRIYG